MTIEHSRFLSPTFGMSGDLFLTALVLHPCLPPPSEFYDRVKLHSSGFQGLINFICYTGNSVIANIRKKETDCRDQELVSVVCGIPLKVGLLE